MLKLLIIYDDQLHEKYYPTNYSGKVIVNNQTLLMMNYINHQFNLNSTKDYILIRNQLYPIKNVVIKNAKKYECINPHTSKKVIIYAFIKKSRMYQCQYYDITNTNQIIISNDLQASIRINDFMFINSKIIITKQNDNFIIQLFEFSHPVFINSRQNQHCFHSFDIVKILGVTLLIIDSILIIASEYIMTITLNKYVYTKYNFVSTTIHEIDLNDDYKEEKLILDFNNFAIKKVANNHSNQQLFSSVFVVVGMLSLYLIVYKDSSSNNSSVTYIFLFSIIIAFINQLLLPITLYLYRFIKNCREVKLKTKMLEDYLSSIDEKAILLYQQKTKSLNKFFPPYSKVLLSYSYINKYYQRFPSHQNFLMVRLGTYLFKEKIAYEINHFNKNQLDSDRINSFLEKSYEINHMPFILSFLDVFTLGLQGNMGLLHEILELLLTRLTLFHPRKYVRFVLFLNMDKKELEELSKYIYCFNEDYTMRYSAFNKENHIVLAREINQLISIRKQNQTNFPVYFIVIEYQLLIKYFLYLIEEHTQLQNLGIRLIIIFQNKELIPSFIKSYISIENEIIYSDSSQKTKLIIDKNDVQEKYQLVNDKEQIIITSSYKFLKQVLAPHTFNIANNWLKNKTTNSLKIPIGIETNHSLVYLDINEAAHGPHGLIAGTTGSGKSEWLLNFILLYSLLYSPKDINFFIIDYKGGALVNSFYKEEMILPHISGSLTNLDSSKLLRAFKALDSEVNRRFILFKETQQLLQLDTIDIYQYQSLYYSNKVSIGLPHLLIIVDEFAELKSNFSEMMQQLISLSRIGRSLGIHLILATQRPAGIVDDQIISNSSFKICFKVQEKSESIQMIQNDKAKNIKEVGEFYMIVGNHEYESFAKGFFSRYSMDYMAASRIMLVDQLGRRENNRTIQTGKSVFDEIFQSICIEAKHQHLKSNSILLDPLLSRYPLPSQSNQANTVRIGVYEIMEKKKHQEYIHSFTTKGHIVIFGEDGSGKTASTKMLLQQLLHNQIYCFDLGDGSLYQWTIDKGIKTYYINDKEKIADTLNELINIMEQRKQKSITNKDQIKNIYICIHHIDNLLKELFSYKEIMLQLITNGQYYNIYFIITCNFPSLLDFRILQACKQKICLYLQDKHEYYYAFNQVVKYSPPQKKGRGLLMHQELIYEFQSYSPYES